ncbi:hypothetical protein [Alicyclobacillus sp. ALC3]|uniref:hypothetical protein n=1 Tax=Alicyclobacillus sp. ALC3 TaxID=2796143 RepID=UPI002378BB8B|nr:hypothetical protein [Alicyclobacillus sp. ALC3]WDL98580.1 hypothetical protein JC200_07885 [Alicyclobacillus sp. ALC3]
MAYVFDCVITETTLDEISQSFVPVKDVYFFDDESMANSCLRHGLTVFSRQEFTSTFPLFSLHYGSVYHLWSMKLSQDVFVLVAKPSELVFLTDDLRQRLLARQIDYGRGHIYHAEWFDKLNLPKMVTPDVGGEWPYFLTWDDWWKLPLSTRRQWIVEWLRQWRQEDALGVPFDHANALYKSVPYELLKEYAGTFGSEGTANCFAAAIATVVGASNPDQGRVLISEWLHPGPFFRLLHSQGYVKCAEYRDTGNLTFRPADVLVWYTGDGMAGHAGYAVSHDSVFQKQGQGWVNPWQVIKIEDVWYNKYLDSGGCIAVFRRRG